MRTPPGRRDRDHAHGDQKPVVLALPGGFDFTERWVVCVYVYRAARLLRHCPGGFPFRWALLGLSEHGSPPQRISHGVQVGTLILRGLYFEQIPESLSVMRNFRAICRRWCAVASAVFGLIPTGGNNVG